MDPTKAFDEALDEASFGFLTRFVVNQLHRFSDEQLDAIATQASFELQDRDKRDD